MSATVSPQPANALKRSREDYEAAMKYCEKLCECVVCMGPEATLILPCGKSVCKRCLDKLELKSLPGFIKCPMTRDTFELGRARRDHTREELIESAAAKRVKYCDLAIEGWVDRTVGDAELQELDVDVAEFKNFWEDYHDWLTNDQLKVLLQSVRGSDDLKGAMRALEARVEALWASKKHGIVVDNLDDLIEAITKQPPLCVLEDLSERPWVTAGNAAAWLTACAGWPVDDAERRLRVVQTLGERKLVTVDNAASVAGVLDTGIATAPLPVGGLIDLGVVWPENVSELLAKCTGQSWETIMQATETLVKLMRNVAPRVLAGLGSDQFLEAYDTLLRMHPHGRAIVQNNWPVEAQQLVTEPQHAVEYLAKVEIVAEPRWQLTAIRSAIAEVTQVIPDNHTRGVSIPNVVQADHPIFQFLQNRGSTARAVLDAVDVPLRPPKIAADERELWDKLHQDHRGDDGLTALEHMQHAKTASDAIANLLTRVDHPLKLTDRVCERLDEVATRLQGSARAARAAERSNRFARLLFDRLIKQEHVELGNRLEAAKSKLRGHTRDDAPAAGPGGSIFIESDSEAESHYADSDGGGWPPY